MTDDMSRFCGVCKRPAEVMATVPMCGERPRYPLCHLLLPLRSRRRLTMANDERPEIFYVPGTSTAEGLRALAERFDADDDLVLIGLWNIEPPEREGYPEAYLQVVATHLAEPQVTSTEPQP